MKPDLEKIRTFLFDLKEEISELLNMKEKVFRVYFHDPMSEAWPGLKDAFSKLDDNLFQLDNYNSDTIAESSLFQLLEDAGLTGTQLNLKIQAFYKSRDRWHKSRRIKFENSQVSRKPRWRKSLKSMLSWGELLVGSLANSLSSLKLPIEIIKEFLECLELALLDSA